MSSLKITPMCLLLAAGVAAGQGNVSATVTPNPAPPGTNINVVVTNASGQTITFTDSCTVKEVRSGTPTGPTVFSPICLLIITNVPPSGTIGGGWNQTNNNGVQVPEGTYWMKVRYQLNNTFFSEWFSVDITSDPNFPTLGVSPGSGAAIGQPLSLDLNAPNAANNLYIAAASLTTNSGQSLPTLFIHLDNDFLFNLSITDPTNPLFNNLQGALDPTGAASGIGINIPNLSALQDMPLHFQAVVVDNTGALQLTNAVHLTVQ